MLVGNFSVLVKICEWGCEKQRAAVQKLVVFSTSKQIIRAQKNPRECNNMLLHYQFRNLVMLLASYYIIGQLHFKKGKFITFLALQWTFWWIIDTLTLRGALESAAYFTAALLALFR